MLASAWAAEFYEIWRTRSTQLHNHVCQIFSRSVQGLRSSTQKLPFPIDLLRRPYSSVRTAVRHCDHHVVVVVVVVAVVLVVVVVVVVVAAAATK